MEKLSKFKVNIKCPQEFYITADDRFHAAKRALDIVYNEILIESIEEETEDGEAKEVYKAIL